MTTQSNTTQPPIFNAVRQMTVAPDRYYRVELWQHGLKFVKTGSQFDTKHAGSLGRNKMEHAGGASVPVSEEGIEMSKSKMILLGLGMLILAVFLLFFFAAKLGRLSFGFVGLAAFGGVLMIAGFVKPSEKALAEKKHDFDVEYGKVQSAVLEMPKKEGAVAKLKLQVHGEKKPINLALKTYEDLGMVKTNVMPLFGPAARIA